MLFPLAELDKLERLRILVLSIKSLKGNLHSDFGTQISEHSSLAGRELGQLSDLFLSRLDCLIIYPNGEAPRSFAEEHVEVPFTSPIAR